MLWILKCSVQVKKKKLNPSKIKSKLRKELSGYNENIPEEFFNFLKDIIKVDSRLHDRIVILVLKYNKASSFSFDKKRNQRIKEKSIFELNKIIEDITKTDIKRDSFETKMLEDLITKKLKVNPIALEIKDFGLDKLPNFISSKKNLERLVLNDNEISIIPNWLEDFESLSILDLRNNNLKELPEYLFYLPNLEKIDLVNDEWQYNTLSLKGNPIEFPPIEILSRGIEATREYFNLIDKQGGAELFEAKLIVLGAGGAGKTTMTKKLLDSTYKVPNNEKTTHGIEIKKYEFDYYINERVVDFKASIWDFGGQEIYHSTHQFFLTRKSLYVLVSDNRKEDTDFDYWLYTISILSDYSPILIVLNEKENRIKALNTKGLKKHFPSLRDIVSVNFSTNKGLQGLEDNIQYYLSTLNHVGEKLPAKWVNVRNTLENESKNYISLKDFFKICNNEGILEESQIRFVSQYLHDLGVILHFQNDITLDNIVILNPEWATHAVYKVLDSEKVIENQGAFDIKDLGAIWKDSLYPKEKHPDLLNLMLKFQLAYQIEGKSKFIAPQLLPVEEPEYDFPNTSHLEYQYKYVFMPKGIISILIVKVHKNIKNKIVWKNGVVLIYDDTEVEITENYIHRTLNIRISGVKAKEILFWVKEHIKSIHANYPKIAFREMIPCICTECENNNESQYFDLRVLERALMKGKETVECRTSFEDINIKSLIDNIHLFKFQADDLLELLSQAKYNLFFDRLEKKLKGTILYEEFIHLKSRYSDLMHHKVSGTISIEQFTLSMNKQTDSAIKLIKKAEKFI